MAAAGLIFASTGNLLLLLIAGTIGVISPNGNEVGPFLSIEQAALSHVVSNRTRTAVFAWYTVAGAMATAIGSLVAGVLVQLLQKTSATSAESYRAIVVLYAFIGFLLAFLFGRVSSATEVSSPGEEPAGPA
jgi:MFS family permease